MNSKEVYAGQLVTDNESEGAYLVKSDMGSYSEMPGLPTHGSGRIRTRDRISRCSKFNVGKSGATRYH